jgi:hypothetical protein
MSQTHFLTITQSTKKAIYLSKLIAEEDILISSDLDLTIILFPNITINLIDNLEEVGVTNLTLKTIVKTNSKLTIFMRSIGVLKKIGLNQEKKNDRRGEVKLLRIIKEEVKKELEGVEEDNITSNVLNRVYTICLVGKRSQAKLFCYCFGDKNKIFTFKTLQEHVTKETKSFVSVKSVLEESAKLFCNGLIRIFPGGEKAAALLKSKSILLGKNTNATLAPMLEIEAHDVACKHGAAVSSIDYEQLFYLQARGIDVDAARTMLINSFLQDTSFAKQKQ